MQSEQSVHFRNDNLDQLADQELEALKDPEVLNGLSADQRRRLGYILLHCSAHRALWSDDAHRRDQLIKVYNDKSPGQIRKLDKKLGKAKQALKKLQEYASSIGDADTGKGNALLASELESCFLPYVDSALAALDTSARKKVLQLRENEQQPDRNLLARMMDEIYLPEPQSSLGGKAPEPLDHRDYVVLRLFPFFVTQCGLDNNDADVRIAQIGNTRWRWRLKYRATYEGGESWMGCEAIRKRRTRLGRRYAILKRRTRHRKVGAAPKVPGTSKK